MNFLLKPLQALYSIYAMIVFVVLMLFVFLFSILASFFGKMKGGNLIYKAFKVWGYSWFTLIGIRHKTIYEVPHDSSRQYIFVANHSTYMDIPPIVVAIKQPVRILAKYEMSKVPVFGFIYRCATILVDRRDAEKRANSVREMINFIHHHISIFIFPEGTFNETDAPLKEFYDGAFRIAIETQTPVKPMLFVDALERLHYRSIFSFTPGICRTVFLEEVPVENLQLEDIDMLKNKVHAVMEAGLLRYRSGTIKEA